MNVHESPLQHLDKEFIEKYGYQNLAMALLINIEETFLAKILMMKKNQVKLN